MSNYNNKPSYKGRFAQWIAQTQHLESLNHIQLEAALGAVCMDMLVAQAAGNIQIYNELKAFKADILGDLMCVTNHVRFLNRCFEASHGGDD